MVHVYGVRAQRLTARTGGIALEQLVAVGSTWASPA